jgi:predicted transcriptional regulator
MERNIVQYYNLSEEVREIIEGQSSLIEDLFKELQKLQERVDELEKTK